MKQANDQSGTAESARRPADRPVETGPQAAGVNGSPSTVRSPRFRRREILMQVAGELLNQKPFEAVTVEEICAEAGISGPALYRHFPNKQALLSAILEEPLEELLAFARTTSTETEDPDQAIKKMIDIHLQSVMRSGGGTIAFTRNEYSLPDDQRRRLRKLMRLYVEEWVDVLTALRPDLSDGQLRVVAHGLFGMMNSSKQFHSGLDAETIVQTIAPMVYQAAIASPGVLAETSPQ